MQKMSDRSADESRKKKDILRKMQALILLPLWIGLAVKGQARM
jgi:hypothetical protein